MAELSVATQSPGISLLSLGLNPLHSAAAVGCGGSLEVYPALGAKRCGTCCAGQYLSSGYPVRCARDWICLWHHADCAAFPGSFKCHQWGFLPHSGSLSVTVSFVVYKSVLKAIQKSEEGHPFKAYLDVDITLSQKLSKIT